MTVKKITGYQAPYRSLTFREVAESLAGKNGVLWMDGTVTQAGSDVIIPPFKVIQDGLIYEKDVPTTVAAPSMPVPYYVVVTAPTATNIDNLVFTYAKSPEDLTEQTVVLASYDGGDWRTAPIISIDGVINNHNLENIETGRVGPYYGLKTEIVGSDYVTSAGILIDKFGERQQFLDSVSHAVIGGDPDWRRVDRVLYRRPTDSEVRVGGRTFELGGTYADTPAFLYSTNLFNNTLERQSSKVVTASDNTAHIFTTTGTGGSYALYYAKVSSDRQSIVTSEISIIPGLSDPNFGVVIDASDLMHVVYIASGNVQYQRVTDGGILSGSAKSVDTQSGDCSNPRCCLDDAENKLYIVYNSTVGAVEQIFFASRDVATGDTATPAVQISSSSNNLVYPDVFVDLDYTVHIVWENSTNGKIEYQRFNDIIEEIDDDPAIISNDVNYGGGTISTNAKRPRVYVANNFEVVIGFLQDKGTGLYGLSVWHDGYKYQEDIFAATEDFIYYDFHLESIHNSLSLLLARSNSVDFVKMKDEDVLFTINLSTNTPQGVSFVKDRLGSFYNSWSENGNGGFGAKTVAESKAWAFSMAELASDILLSRMVQPDGLVINWVPGGIPGSVFDFYVAHGASVTMEWEVSAAEKFDLGSGLEILDMYTNINYTVNGGSFTMPENSAIYVLINGVDLVVTPVVTPVSMVPWDQGAVVLGFIKNGEFNPALLGVAGMAQLDSGEGIIFGEDLPQSIRARLGIIDETAYQSYTSTIGINTSDTYPQAISKLDIMSGQNRHVRLVRLDASWSKEVVDTLKIFSSCYLQIPNLPENRNEIQAQEISIPNDGDVAYVSVNRIAGAAAQLTVNVTPMSSLVPDRDTLIVARRVGETVYVDLLGEAYEKGTYIKGERALDLREWTRADVIDKTTDTLPTGTGFTSDGHALVEGERVLFAHSSLNGIYQINNVGVAISWTKLKDFGHSSTPSHGDHCIINDKADNKNNTIVWRYDVNIAGDSQWLPASLSEANRTYLGIGVNADKSGGAYQDQLTAGQLNNIVQDGDPLEKAIKRLDVRPDVIKKVNLIDRISTTLPTGTTADIDGKAIVNGDKVLFANPALNGVYLVSGVGTALSWVKLYEFGGSQDPSQKDLVQIFEGTEINRTLWSYDPTRKWYRVATYDNCINVRAADFTTTVLPTGASLTVDTITIDENNTVLYGHASINRIFKVTGIGTSIKFEELNVFEGKVEPQDGSRVLAEDGTVSDVLYEYDEEAAAPNRWHHLSQTYQNKTYLGTNSPSKSGGEYQDQLSAGQLNNVVQEGDNLEKAIKRLDVRHDVVKQVRAIDLTATTLPTGAGATIDGVVLANGDKVLFGSTALLGIYRISGVGGTIAWEKLYEFGGAQTPQPMDLVGVRAGTGVNQTVWQYNPAIDPPWHRLSGDPQKIWTGADQVTTPDYDGTLSAADDNLRKALITIDKYFKSLQLREHPTDKKRVIVTGSDVLKTDGTTISNAILDKLLAFDGAQIHFEEGNIYNAAGTTVIDTFTTINIPLNRWFWYGIGFNGVSGPVDNRLEPEFVINVASGDGPTRQDALKPTFTCEYVIGAAVMHGASIGVNNIPQGQLVQINEMNNSSILTRITALEAIVAVHTSEINDLQNSISTILDNKPAMHVETSVASQTLVNFSEFTVSVDNTHIDVDVYIDGRWQVISKLGDFTDGAFRKNTTGQIEFAEALPAGKFVVILKRDPAQILANQVKLQRFKPVAPQSVFTLDPLIFTVIDDNTVLDVDYFIDGRWNAQSQAGDFSDGFVRKNSILEIELGEALQPDRELIVARRLPTAGGCGPGGGTGGDTDLENITVNLGFVTPKTVGTLLKPASSFILKDKANSDVYEIEVDGGILQARKISP